LRRLGWYVRFIGAPEVDGVYFAGKNGRQN
jgi:hypothetical protein